jgi:hypothetical protein
MLQASGEGLESWLESWLEKESLPKKDSTAVFSASGPKQRCPASAE